MRVLDGHGEGPVSPLEGVVAGGPSVWPFIGENDDCFRACGPGGTPIRGFDQHVIEEFTSESCTVRMVNGFKQYTWRKVAHRSNERLDCLVYALAALVHARVNLDKLSGPVIEPEKPKEEQLQQPREERPAWGVIHRARLPTDTDWQKVVATRPEDKSRSPWGVQNRPMVW
jgi:Phage terminase large subunit (GpA)